MKQVPVFYLRKPWAILLRQTSIEANKIGSSLKIGSISRDSVSVYKSADLKLSNDEDAFIRSIELKYDDIYTISHGAVTKICLAIPKLWLKLSEGNSEILEAHKLCFRGKEAEKKSILQEKINNPLSKITTPLNKDIVVYDTMAKYICMIAKFACKNNTEEVSEIDKILKSIDKIPSLSGKVKPEIVDLKAIEMHERFWRQEDNNSIPKVFNNSHWISYERTDANSNKKATWGIAKSYIYIGQQNNRGYTPIVFKSKYNKKEYESYGLITYDTDSKYLVAQKFRNAGPKDDTPETPSFFIMRVRDAENQSLLIGHYVNYSIYFERFITKTVVWHEDNNTFLPEDMVNGDADFNSIPVSIRRFLYSRSRNRLSLPFTGLSNLNNLNDKDRSLHNWIEERVRSVYQDKKLRACVDKYYVCYFYGDAVNPIKISEMQEANSLNETNALDDYFAKYIRIDNLSINYDDNAVAFSATYNHSIHDVDKTLKLSPEVNTYSGKVARKDSTIQIFCEHDKYVTEYRPKSTAGNFILLNFKLPECSEDKALDVFNNYNYFEGLISGLSDADDSPLSFRALIIKRRVGLNKGKNKIKLNLTGKEKRSELSEIVIDYFKTNSNQYQIKLKK